MSAEQESQHADQEALLSALCDGTLGEDDARRLSEQVAADAAARRFYLEYMDLHALLGGQGPAAALPDLPEPARATSIRAGGRQGQRGGSSRLRLVRWAGWFAATAAMIVLVAWAALQVFGPPSPAPSVPVVARLVELTGRAEIHSPSGEMTEVQVGTEVKRGQTLRTGADDSSAVLELADGSRLELSPEAQLHFGDGEGPGGRLRLLLSTGLLRGDVKPRPPGDLLVVATPQAEMQLGDTRFLISASLPETTEVESESGSVWVKRLADGRSVEVTEGSAAVASSVMADTMEVRPVPPFAAAPRSTMNAVADAGLVFSPDGRRLLALARTRWTWLDLTTAQALPSRELGSDVIQVVGSGPGGPILVVHSPGLCEWLDSGTGQVTSAWELNHRKPLHWAFALSEHGRRLAAGHFVSGPPNEIKLWDRADGRELPAVPTPHPVRTVALSADGRRLAASYPAHRRNPSHQLLVYDVDTGKETFAVTPPERVPHLLVFTPDARRLASATDHGAVQVWDVQSQQCVISRGPQDGWTRPVKALAFSPDGRLLAVGMADGRVRVWDTMTDREVGLLNCGTRFIGALAFSPDGRTLAASTIRGPTTLWDVPAE